jgi:hypothetical protein
MQNFEKVFKTPFKNHFLPLKQAIEAFPATFCFESSNL